LVKNRFGIAAHSNVFYDTSARQGNRQKLTQGEYERLDGDWMGYILPMGVVILFVMLLIAMV